jgi:hypothetical protein
MVGDQNPYVVDLSFEADLCLQQLMTGGYRRWRRRWLQRRRPPQVPVEIIEEALFLLFDAYGRGRNDGPDDLPPDPPSPPPPLPRPDEGAAIDLDLELRELVKARGDRYVHGR